MSAKKPTKKTQKQPAHGGCDAVPCFRIISAIRRYNRWRRGDDKLMTPCPTRTGKELDAICELAEAQNAALAELAAACRERMAGRSKQNSFRLLNAVKAAESFSKPFVSRRPTSQKTQNHGTSQTTRNL